MELFSLNNKCALDNHIQEIDFIKSIPSSLATVNNTNTVISIGFSREDAYISLQNSYFSIYFEDLRQDNTRYVDNDQISLVNFGHIDLFSEAKLVLSSEKHLKKV